jgi:hypothetical protein
MCQQHFKKLIENSSEKLTNSKVNETFFFAFIFIADQVFDWTWKVKRVGKSFLNKFQSRKTSQLLRFGFTLTESKSREIKKLDN